MSRDSSIAALKRLAAKLVGDFAGAGEYLAPSTPGDWRGAIAGKAALDADARAAIVAANAIIAVASAVLALRHSPPPAQPGVGVAAPERPPNGSRGAAEMAHQP